MESLVLTGWRQYYVVKLYIFVQQITPFKTLQLLCLMSLTRGGDFFLSFLFLTSSYPRVKQEEDEINWMI